MKLIKDLEHVDRWMVVMDHGQYIGTLKQCGVFIVKHELSTIHELEMALSQIIYKGHEQCHFGDLNGIFMWSDVMDRRKTG